MIAFVDLVILATEKVSLIRWNIIWNRWKSTLRARSIRVRLNQGTEMKYTVYFVNPLEPKGSPFDEYNRLALDRVKSISHYWALKG